MSRRTEDSARIFVPPPLIYAGALVIGLALDDRLSGETFPPSLPLLIGGGIFVLAGIALIAAGLGAFWRKGTRPEPWAPASTLVTSGIYRVTRNPMYLGITVLYAGLALLFESVLAGVLLLPLLVVMDRVIIAREEAYLLRQFGPRYEEFRRSVRRWI